MTKKEMAHSANIQESIVIHVPKEKLWETTALQFSRIGDWSPGVVRSKGNGTSQLGAACMERLCEPSYRGFTKTIERIVDYKPEIYQFTYQIVAVMPKIVQRATNTWTHIDRGEATQIMMDVNMELKGFVGWLMRKPMQKRMVKILRENLEELKTFVETGQVHERKKRVNS